jgi:hypothetical protein
MCDIYAECSSCLNLEWLCTQKNNSNINARFARKNLTSCFHIRGTYHRMLKTPNRNLRNVTWLFNIKKQFRPPLKDYIHDDVKYDCAECEQHFTNKTFSHLKDHEKVVHWGRKLQCDKCVKFYKWRSDLNHH